MLQELYRNYEMPLSTSWFLTAQGGGVMFRNSEHNEKAE
jgi:hypothetical protein